MVEPAIAHCTEQHSVGFETSSECFFRQRRPVVLDGDAADAVMLEAELISADVGYSLQDPNRLLGYFWADSVTWQYDNAQLHAGCISCGCDLFSRMPPRCAKSMAIRSC